MSHWKWAMKLAPTGAVAVATLGFLVLMRTKVTLTKTDEVTYRKFVEFCQIWWKCVPKLFCEMRRHLLVQLYYTWQPLSSLCTNLSPLVPGRDRKFDQVIIWPFSSQNLEGRSGRPPWRWRSPLPRVILWRYDEIKLCLFTLSFI